MSRHLEAIIRSRFGYPGEEDGFGWLTEYEGWNFNSGNYLFTTDTK